MVKVRIPAPLRPKAGNRSEVVVPAKTLHEAVQGVVREHPDLKAHLLADDGSFHRFVNYFVNGKDARTLQGPDTKVSDADTVLVLPAVAGGQDGGFGGAGRTAVGPRARQAPRGWSAPRRASGLGCGLGGPRRLGPSAEAPRKVGREGVWGRQCLPQRENGRSGQ